MKVEIRNIQNQKAGDLDLCATIFGLPIRSDILARVVHWQLAKRRSGNHQTRSIGQISGTTRKPFKQKGTGQARQGSLRSPQMRGGAVIFGPVVRDHGYPLPKKVRRLGLKTALSAKLAEGKLIFVEDFAVASSKTKDGKAMLAAFGFESALFVDGPAVNESFFASVRNIPYMDVLPQQGLNVYDIMRRDYLVVSRAALAHIEERLK